MQTYEIIVSGRAVHANSADTTLVRTSIGIDKIHVLFDNEEWTAFPVRVTFANGDTIISTSLTLAEIDAPEWAAEAECAIPWEVIQDLGGIRITFQGTDASGNHIITEASGEPLSVVEAGDVGSGTVPSPAPSVDEWNQAYANAMAAANSASGAAESATEAAERANTAAADAEQVLADGIPLMDDDTRGGAQLGYGLVIDDGKLSLDDTLSFIPTSEKGSAGGVAELDSNGLVISSQLPSYVDDVLEYASTSDFPATGESGKIYVALDTNLTYRWTGSAYAEISPSLALGETSSTAYRGDRGAAAYAHAVTNKGSAFSSDLYKITTNSEGHVTAATPATSADIIAFLNNQAITPASVTASGAIQGSSISDGVGTLAQLRESVSQAVTHDSSVTEAVASTGTTYGQVWRLSMGNSSQKYMLMLTLDYITLFDVTNSRWVRRIAWSERQ